MKDVFKFQSLPLLLVNKPLRFIYAFKKSTYLSAHELMAEMNCGRCSTTVPQRVLKTVFYKLRLPERLAHFLRAPIVLHINT